MAEAPVHRRQRSRESRSIESNQVVSPAKINFESITFFVSISDLNLQAPASTTDSLLRGAMSFFHKAANTTKIVIPESMVHIDLQNRLRDTIPFQTEKLKSKNPNYALGISVPITAQEIKAQVLCFSVVLTEEGNGRTVAYAELPMKDLVRKYLHNASNLHLPLKVLSPINTAPSSTNSRGMKTGGILTLKLARVARQPHPLLTTQDTMMRSYAFYNGEYSTPMMATEEVEEVDLYTKIPKLFMHHMLLEWRQRLSQWGQHKIPSSDLFQSGDPIIDRTFREMLTLCAPATMLTEDFAKEYLSEITKQVDMIKDMAVLAELLEENKVMFKPNSTKEKLESLAMATNLHLAYFKLYCGDQPFLRLRSQSMDFTGGDFDKQRTWSGDLDSRINVSSLPTPTMEKPLRHHRRTFRSSSFDDDNQLRHEEPDSNRERSGSIDFQSTEAIKASFEIDTLASVISCAIPSAEALDHEVQGLFDMEEQLVTLSAQMKVAPATPPTPVKKLSNPSPLPLHHHNNNMQDDETRSSSHDSSSNSTDDGVDGLTKSARRMNMTNMVGEVTGKVKRTISHAKIRSDSMDWVLKTTKLAPEPEAPTLSSLWQQWELLKLRYLFRKSICVSQSLTILITAFLTKLEIALEDEMELQQLGRIGLLIGWESLCYPHGKEYRMLSDAFVAVKFLERFELQLLCEPEKAFTLSSSLGRYCVHIGLPKDIFSKLSDTLQTGQSIKVTSVLFTQGINEMQSFANMVSSASGLNLQARVNRDSFQSLQQYHRDFLDMQKELNVSMRFRLNNETMLDSLMPLVGRNATKNKAPSNTWMLLEASDITRRLNGMRITCCSSGADRTAMSVTLEQARILYSKRSANMSASGEDNEQLKARANMMREYGVRIAVAMKNTGRYEYAFNSIQRKLLPELYRPPINTIQDMASSLF
ncbi:inositol-3,4-bisphosphate 4-phosphatase [Thraustotheca clavata]|uniref:Inositol-3,4-bisphosphate 4-phosphatase n=1 Tax=Thraustotheca clavata TaxID=74557 RepID=A0A1V9ZWQ8_9STRA|nr:inositol-3,4-bisphosphate 4-phosphatase [Thraustotheca clavata]